MPAPGRPLDLHTKARDGQERRYERGRSSGTHVGLLSPAPAYGWLDSLPIHRIAHPTTWCCQAPHSIGRSGARRVSPFLSRRAPNATTRSTPTPETTMPTNTVDGVVWPRTNNASTAVTGGTR